MAEFNVLLSSRSCCAVKRQCQDCLPDQFLHSGTKVDFNHFKMMIQPGILNDTLPRFHTNVIISPGPGPIRNNYIITISVITSGPNSFAKTARIWLL